MVGGNKDLDGPGGWPVRIDVLPRWLPFTVPVAAVVVALLTVGVGWLLLHDEVEPQSPGEVVAEFFHAQRAGDCERLIEVVSTKTWSGGGERSRAEFLDQCDETLGRDGLVSEFEPGMPERVSIRTKAGRAEVATNEGYYVSSLADWDQDGAAGDDDLDAALAGSLVREDGEWKVEAGEGLLRIGPSIATTMRAYLEAYANRECDRLAHFASADASRDLQARCDDASQERLDTAGLPRVKVSFDGGSNATATFGDAPVGAAELVKEGLSWKVASFSVLPDDLDQKLLDEVTVDGQPCFEFTYPSDEEPVPGFGDIEPVAFIRREYSDAHIRLDGRTCEFMLSLYAFGSDEEAKEAADSMWIEPTHAFIAYRSVVVEVELQDDLEAFGVTDAVAIASAQVEAL